MKAEQAAFQVMLEATALLDQCGELVVVGGWVPEIHFSKQNHLGTIDVGVVLNKAATVVAENGQDYDQARQSAFQDASELLQALAMLVE